MAGRIPLFQVRFPSPTEQTKSRAVKAVSSTGCNTRHERWEETGPMSCVAASGSASESPSALNGRSPVKMKTGGHRGKEFKGKVDRKRVRQCHYNRFCLGEKHDEKITGANRERKDNLTEEWNKRGVIKKKLMESDREQGRESKVGRCTSADTAFITKRIKITFFHLTKSFLAFPATSHIQRARQLKKNTPLAQIALLEG